MAPRYLHCVCPTLWILHLSSSALLAEVPRLRASSGAHYDASWAPSGSLRGAFSATLLPTAAPLNDQVTT
eukprot:2243924-Pyramimonas_sp.AAC.1